jgi:hypothetical protein
MHKVLNQELNQGAQSGRSIMELSQGAQPRWSARTLNHGAQQRHSDMRGQNQNTPPVTAGHKYSDPKLFKALVF